MKTYLRIMRTYARSDGRATRLQYAAFLLFALALVPSLTVLVAVTLGGSRDLAQTVAVLVGLLHVIPVFAISAQRLHDIGGSRRWLLLLFLPPLNMLLIATLCLWPGRIGDAQRVAGDDGHLSTGRHAQRLEPQAEVVQLSGQSSVLERLERLQALKANGVIDDAEFQEIRAQVLGRVAS